MHIKLWDTGYMVVCAHYLWQTCIELICSDMSIVWRSVWFKVSPCLRVHVSVQRSPERAWLRRAPSWFLAVRASSVAVPNLSVSTEPLYVIKTQRNRLIENQSEPEALLYQRNAGAESELSTYITREVFQIVCLKITRTDNGWTMVSVYDRANDRDNFDKMKSSCGDVVSDSSSPLRMRFFVDIQCVANAHSTPQNPEPVALSSFSRSWTLFGISVDTRR